MLALQIPPRLAAMQPLSSYASPAHLTPFALSRSSAAARRRPSSRSSRRTSFRPSLTASTTCRRTCCSFSRMALLHSTTSARRSSSCSARSTMLGRVACARSKRVRLAWNDEPRTRARKGSRAPRSCCSGGSARAPLPAPCRRVRSRAEREPEAHLLLLDRERARLRNDERTVPCQCRRAHLSQCRRPARVWES